MKQQSLSTFFISDVAISHELLLVPDLVYPVILGVDLLQRIKAKVDLETEKLLFYVEDRWHSASEYHNKRHCSSVESVNLKSIQCKKILVLQNHLIYNPTEEHFHNVSQRSSLGLNEQSILYSLLCEFKEVFSDKPGRVRGYVHHIKLVNKSPFNQRQYPIPLSHRSAIQKQFDRMEEWGLIRWAATQYVSPIIIIITLLQLKQWEIFSKADLQNTPKSK